MNLRIEAYGWRAAFFVAVRLLKLNDICLKKLYIQIVNLVILVVQSISPQQFESWTLDTS